MTHVNDRRQTAFAACGIAVLLAVASCATPTASNSTPSPAPATPSVPVATATITSTPTSSPSPSLEITASPSPSPPPANRLPLVNSCDPTSVPGAVPVAPASGVVSSFLLQVPILMYHRIVPLSEAGNSLPSLVVPPATFDAQLSALETAGWRTITVSALADDLEAGIRPAPKTFVITIDDGWADGYTYALPILVDHGFVATYYVIAGRINEPDFLSVDQLQALVAADNEIGDHTMDHVSLGGGTDARLTYEIDGAAATIALATGRWPETLAYPSGHFSSAAISIIQACGMKMAVIEGDGTYESWATRFTTPRVKVYPGTSPATLLSWVEHPWLPAQPTPTPALPTPTPAPPSSVASSPRPTAAQPSAGT